MSSRGTRDNMRNTRSDIKHPIEYRAPQQTSIMPQQAAQQYQRQVRPQNMKATRSQSARQGYIPPVQPEMNKGFISAASQLNGVNGYSRDSAQYTSKKKGMGLGVKITIVVLCTLLVAVVGFGIAVAQYVSGINENLGGNKTQEEQMVIKEQLAPTKTFEEPFYMLLIGSDARSDGSVEGERSDTNILCRVDPTQNLVTMVSIPRDTKIDIDGYGTNKFNAAYTFGGTAGVIHEASELCGVDISHYAEVNFESLIALVDVVGGVTVDVPELIDDPDAGEFIIEPGVQLLDGDHALEFARCRSYVDGDFTRTSNQRLLIQALAEKVLSMPATELPKVIKEVSKCVTTDMSVKDIIALATQFKNAGDLTIYSAMVPSTAAMIDGISYVICDEYSLNLMMEAVESGENPLTIVTGGSAVGSYLSDNPYGGALTTSESIGNSELQ